MLWYAIFLIAVSVILMAVLYRYYDFRELTTAEKQIIQNLEDVGDKISERLGLCQRKETSVITQMIHI